MANEEAEKQLVDAMMGKTTEMMSEPEFQHQDTIDVPKVDRIDELTPEQEAMLPKIRDEWIAWGLCTDRAVRNEAEFYVKMAYEQAGQKIPERIFWVDSPMAGHELHCKLRKEEGMADSESWVTPFYGQHEASWLGFYDAFRRFGLREADKFTGLIELGKRCNWVWMFETTAICVERPVYVEQDAQNRLHSLTRKAIEYPDSWGLYMIHGIPVDEKVVLHPETLTVADIDAQTNAEVRRVMLARFGEGRYIEESGTQCVAEDDFGKLYRRELPNDEPLCMVRVINSTPEPDGENKVYWLRVPAESTTPRGAIAWTFGQTEQDYNPSVET